MADTKITALTAITTVDPAADVLPIVDVSDTSMAASGTTKKITSNQILGAGGTATLASATITGDLTVRSGNKLILNRADNAISSQLFDAGGGAGLTVNNLNGDGFLLKVASNSVYQVGSSYVQTWYDGAGGTRMTLNSTGLGVGVASPAFKLDVAGSAGSGIRFTGNSVQNVIGETGGNGLVGTVSNHNLGLYTNATLRALIDSSGNVGIGVTPSAWATGTYKSLQIGQSSSISAGVASELVVVGSNCYFDTTDSRWERITSGYTSQYYQTGGTHVWRIGGTAGANTDCSFTSAMTLDASGNLLVGKSVSLFSTVGVEASGTGFISATNSASTNATTNLSVYSTGAAAFRFYVGLGGTVFATNTTISAISDARLKENVQDLDVGLGAILALKPRKFDWKEGKGKDIKGDRGFIAQEFEQVFPQLVDEWKDAAPEGEAPYKSVRQDLIPVLVKAIQELTARVQTLETR